MNATTATATAPATTWVLVSDSAVCETCWTYDHAPVVAGPFATREEANAYAPEEDLVAVQRAA